MADIRPEYMPLCIAFVQTMTNGEWRKPLSSTHGWSPYTWINGPIARQLGISYGKGMINNENNKKFARFIDFAMLNIGGYYIKENRMGTFGYLTPWSFSEDEKACLEVGWNPYHVDKGFHLNDNTVTAASAMFWGSELTPQTSDSEKLKNIIAFDITEKQQNSLGNTNPQVYRAMLLTENVAKKLKNLYKSKSEYEDALINTARRPIWLRVYAHYWANTGGAVYNQMTLEEHYTQIINTEVEDAKMTDVPIWYKKMLSNTKQMMTGATMNKGNTSIIITGDSTMNKVQILPGGGFETIKMELPDNWDQLMNELGYKPLNNFYLGKEDEGESHIIGPVDVSDILKDGTYRIMPNAGYVNSRGKIFSNITTGVVTYYTSDSGKAMEITNKNLSFIISSLGTSSSIKVTNGIINEYKILPSSISYDIQKDVSALDANIFKDANIIISVNDATPDGSSIVLSSTVNYVMFDLDGDIEILNGNTPGFLTKNNNDYYILNGSSRYESIARLGVKISDNTYKIYTITKDFGKFICTYNSSVETYSIIYHANGGVGEDYVVSKVAYGENILATLAETKITPKENKQFVGWATSENGKAIKEIIIEIEGNKELYAIWKDVEIKPEPAPEPEKEPEKSEISTWAIIGTIVACIVIVVGVSVWYFVIRKRKKIEQSDMDIGLNLNN